ncbi:MAG: LOG family protein [Xanthomonadales bacterium]|nr:LOG family protein [Xanthomonadales bacterium]ODU93740.1 MAG: LOG family protein [Rhodanobacter sp. SCN 66-43]OJY83295.1 MAG: LOG family protein [Xanthomonadales bacterium 66-474]
MNDVSQATPARPATVNAQIVPAGTLDLLSRNEIARLRDATSSGLHALLRSCSLAVLTSGAMQDSARAMLDQYPDFDIQVLQQDRGVKLDLKNAPAQAFVDGKIIRGTNELLFAVVRDIVYVSTRLNSGEFDLSESSGITHAVFDILRNARVLRARFDPNLVVCWGGHAISREEYDYTKTVGYQLGLRGMDICTGCGPGAMKGPMKGATIAHAKQRHYDNRYIGLTEPSIIAAESPNPIVNSLVILPDIEKRLEAFVRVGHGFIVFPGGVGTAEEILYLLGILLSPANASIPFPLVFTGPAESAPYFEQIDRFLRLVLGEAAARRYKIIIDDPVAVAHAMNAGIEDVREHRVEQHDAFFFNWEITVDLPFQQPFQPTHAAMAALDLHRGRAPHELAADMRRAFSGIVAGNVKEEGMNQIDRHGPYEIHGDPEFMRALDALLQSFVAQRRMKLPGSKYVPCYRIVPGNAA